MTVTVVLPAALGGIVSGALLAVARAAGETAPLLFTILTADSRRIPNVFSGRQHRAAAADLREREQPHTRGPGPRLGRGAHPDRHRLHPHDRGPPRHRTIQQILALGMSWKSPSRTSSPTSPRAASASRPAQPDQRRARRSSTSRNVSISYGAFKAVKDVSLAIHEHEITAFIGSSGSGKTTVLRAFNRMNDLIPGARAGR